MNAESPDKVVDADLTPHDAWIGIMMIIDEQDKQLLELLVTTAINRLDYQLLHMPERWRAKRGLACIDRKYWIAIKDKLAEMLERDDGIPF